MDLTRPTSLRLWFALLGGMAAYAVHLLVSFWAVPALCDVRPGAVSWVVGVATVVAVAVAVAATVVAVRARRRLVEVEPVPTRPRSRPDDPDAAWDVSPEWSSPRLLATAGILLSAMALAVIVFEGLTVLMGEPCV